MGMELSRRSLFRGLLAVSALRFLPAVPVAMPAGPVVARTLNPFALGSSDSLTEMVLALLDDEHKMETIGFIRSVPSFRIEMLDEIGRDESLSEALTRHLGDGEWSEWAYTADDVRDALSSLRRRDELLRQAFRYWDADGDQNRANTSEVMTVAEAEVDLSAAA